MEAQICLIWCTKQHCTFDSSAMERRLGLVRWVARCRVPKKTVMPKKEMGVGDDVVDQPSLAVAVYGTELTELQQVESSKAHHQRREYHQNRAVPKVPR